jgi:hypothetical protein
MGTIIPRKQSCPFEALGPRRRRHRKRVGEQISGTTKDSEAFRNRPSDFPLLAVPGVSGPPTGRNSVERRSIAYVQQALGHASISRTVETYENWLPVEASGAVNVLAEVIQVL